MFYHDLDDLPAQYPEHLILIDESQFNELKQDKKNSGFFACKGQALFDCPKHSRGTKPPYNQRIDKSK